MSLVIDGEVPTYEDLVRLVHARSLWDETVYMARMDAVRGIIQADRYGDLEDAFAPDLGALADVLGAWGITATVRRD